jgi:hypothetical protein
MEVGEAWRSAQGEGAKYLVPDGSQGSSSPGPAHASSRTS